MTFESSAQVSINSDGSLPHSSAMLEVKSTTRGLLPPRMTMTELDAIQNPANGLVVFCTDAGPSGNGAFYSYYNGHWMQLITCQPPVRPTVNTPVITNSAITWKWNSVPGASGYKWNTVKDYASATEIGNLLEISENGLVCGTSYQRYVWAYNSCGASTPLTLTATTLSCTFVCGSPFSVNHTQGAVAPVSKQVIYETVTGVPGEPTKCWLVRNLGASSQPLALNDATEASAGWYFQFNTKQGYAHNGTNRTPNSAWISVSTDNNNWLPANDPCTLELGAGWRIPTQAEWNNADINGNWLSWMDGYASPLKLHAAGYLDRYTGNLVSIGSVGYYYSSVKNGIDNRYTMFLSGSQANVGSIYKTIATPLRCIK